MSLTVGVIRFPGTNCETETVRALGQTLAEAVVELVDHRATSLDHLDAVVLPGGFSYGDYLRAGAIAARAPVAEGIRRFAREGGVVLGICNGFQQLQELGLLPGALVRNESLRFHCGTVRVRVDGRDAAVTLGLSRDRDYHLPVAHGQGCFWAKDEEMAQLEERGRIVLRYVDDPNGSRGAVAGVSNEEGNVVGMMPHPERNADTLQGTGDGASFLQALGNFCRGRRTP